MAHGHKKEPTRQDFEALAELLTEAGMPAKVKFGMYLGRYLVEAGSPSLAFVYAVKEHGVWRYAVSHEGGQYLRKHGIDCLPGVWDKGIELVLDI